MSDSNDIKASLYQWCVNGRAVERASLAIESIQVLPTPEGKMLVIEVPGAPLQRFKLSPEAAQFLGALLQEA